jgi:hypothetical protein
MSNVKKLMMTAAGGEALNVEDVFSIYLYDGNASTQTITNDIDLSTEGGMVWLKRRDGGAAHHLYDTERGATKRLRSDSTNAEDTQSNGLTAFNSDGFNIGSNPNINGGSTKNCSWTFRKAPKFFDVVTYTGNQSNRAIPHNLGCEVGMLIVKNITTGSTNWHCYHRGLTNANYAINLNQAGTEYSNSTFWQGTAPTSEVFYLGTNTQVNTTGDEYVAYLFAHNDGDGEFGPDGDADIIKCGSYTCAPTGIVDLGFEPQWIMIKRASGTGDWVMFDAMRGLVVEGNDAYVYANTSGAEVSNTRLNITPTGFSTDTTDYRISSNGETYIYIAIRRGPMAVPESATDVFAIDTFGSTGDGKEPAFRSTFPVDMQIYKSTTGTSPVNTARLTQGKYLSTDTTDAENTGSWAQFDYQNGFYGGNTTTISHYYSWMWRRAPNFFDVVAYEGIGGFNGNEQNHNLSVTPEMIWIKNRDLSKEWIVYHKDLTDYEYYLRLNSTAGEADGSVTMFYAAPTATTFNVGSNGAVNGFGESFIAYLFASLAGVSKVGSYTGTSTTQTIDCGFSSGARFVLIKRTDASDDWYLYDSERGIVSGNDNLLLLNTTGAESTMFDFIDPQSSGFSLPNSGSFGPNVTGASYIFYAIA